jgi:hypothetical protein
VIVGVELLATAKKHGAPISLPLGESNGPKATYQSRPLTREMQNAEGSVKLVV